jgi:hypothetical protein
MIFEDLPGQRRITGKLLTTSELYRASAPGPQPHSITAS